MTEVAAGARLCPACGYSLVAQPLTGLCPECGEEYDAETIVIYGSAPGIGGHLVAAPRKSLVLLILLFACGSAQLLGMRGPLRLATGALSLTAIVFLLWTRSKFDHAAPLQARFNRKGCVQHLNTIDPLIKAGMTIAFIWLACGWSIMTRIERGDIHWLTMAGTGMSVIGTVAFAVHSLARRSADREGLFPRLTDQWHTRTPVPWRNVVTIRVEPMEPSSEGFARVRVRTKWSWVAQWNAVDILADTSRYPDLAKKLDDFRNGAHEKSR